MLRCNWSLLSLIEEYYIWITRWLFRFYISQWLGKITFYFKSKFIITREMPIMIDTTRHLVRHLLAVQTKLPIFYLSLEDLQMYIYLDEVRNLLGGCNSHREIQPVQWERVFFLMTPEAVVCEERLFATMLRTTTSGIKYSKELDSDLDRCDASLHVLGRRDRNREDSQ